MAGVLECVCATLCKTLWMTKREQQSVMSGLLITAFFPFQFVCHGLSVPVGVPTIPCHDFNAVPEAAGRALYLFMHPDSNCVQLLLCE